jgi:hypothetical protein
MVAKPPTEQTNYSRAVYHIKGTPARFIGIVDAPDEQAAISGSSGPERILVRGLEQDAKDLSCLFAMSDPTLILRRAQARKRGERQDEDYDVFDGDRDVGRIYLVHSDDGTETWFWGVSFQVTKRKSYGYAASIEQAKAAFRAEYLSWQGTEKGSTG